MKVLKKHEFKERSESSYEWDKILDGKIYEITEGEDFDCKPLTFAAMARNRAAKRNMGVRMEKSEDGKSWILQAFKLDAAAIKARDEKAAARKAAKAAKAAEEGDDDTEEGEE